MFNYETILYNTGRILTWTVTCIVLIMFSKTTKGQQTDSTKALTGITHDTFYIVHENIPNHKFLGNSWYSAVSYNLSKHHEFNLNIGRTYGIGFVSGGGFNFRMKSWGVGYSYFKNGIGSGQTLNVFGEISNFILPPATVRVDYIFDYQNQKHYLRPSFGLSFFVFDILYGYSFKVVGGKNDFKHGLILRFKYFLGSENWQKSHPNRC